MKFEPKRGPLYLDRLFKIIMGAFIFLFGTILFATSPNNGFSQDADIVIKNDRRVTVKQVFRLINKQTDYKFLFRDDFVINLPDVVLKKGVIKASVLLETSLASSNFTYNFIEDKTVVVIKKPKKESSVELDVAQIKVTGIITDDNGVPLPGVNIIEKGTTIGTSTDLDGKYTISVVNDDAILVFSFIGYISKEVSVGNQTTINLSLKEDTQALDEIVIVGYGSQRKADVTGAVVRVTTEKAANIPNTNVLEAIQGRVAGLNVATSNGAGGGSGLLIRGVNSLNASSIPLIVVNDVIYNGSLSDFNPNDIESVHILKDASSTAVYGARAANGVLLITTKKGKFGKPKFKFSTYTGFQTADKLIDVLDGPGYEQKIADYNTANPNANITLSDVEEANRASGIETNWLDRITRTGIITNHQLDVSGGTEKTNYYISGALFDEGGILENDNFERFTLNLNLITRLTDWWSLDINSSYVTRDPSGRAASIDQAYRQSPYGSFYDENGPGGFARLPIGDALGLHPFINTLIDQELKRTSLRGVLSSKIDIPFIPGLKWTMNYGANIRNQTDHEFINNLLTTESIVQNGIAEKEHRRDFDWTFDNILNYTKTLGEKHRLDLTLLYSRETREFDFTRARANDFVSQELGFNNLGLGAVQQSDSNREAQNSLSQMGRINYVFDNKYAFTYTIRRDGFSAFSEKNKYATFQAGAFAWTLSNEGFLKDSKWLDYLKLRLSYGENGNQGINRFQSLARINNSQYLFGNNGGSITTFNISSLANSDLTWETTTSKNIGLDFHLFNNRISGSFDAYLSNTKDLLQVRSLPAATGFESVLTNIGEVENKGFEFNLNFKNFNNPDFGWDTGIVFSLSRNKIVSLTGLDADGDGIEDDDISNEWFIGEPINVIYGYKTDGIHQSNDTNIPSGFVPGDFRIVDTNGDGNISPDDREILGTISPNYIVSLSNTFRYKGFSLYVLINSIQGGGKDNNYIGDNYDSRSVNPRGFSSFTERFNVQNVPYWTPDNPTNLYPRLDYVAPFNHAIIEDRSFIRIQDISFAYNFNDNVLSEIGFNSLQLYASVKNAHTFTNWTGYNPQTSNTLKNFPFISSYTFGLNLGF